MPTYRIVRGFFNLEINEDGEREIKKRGDTIRLSEKRAAKYGKGLELVVEPPDNSEVARTEEGKAKVRSIAARETK